MRCCWAAARWSKRRGAAQAKASYGRTAFRFALDEIAAIVGLANNSPKRPPVPERYALQAAVMVTEVGKGALEIMRGGAGARGGAAHVAEENKTLTRSDKDGAMRESVP